MFPLPLIMYRPVGPLWMLKNYMIDITLIHIYQLCRFIQYHMFNYVDLIKKFITKTFNYQSEYFYTETTKKCAIWTCVIFM